MIRPLREQDILPALAIFREAVRDMQSRNIDQWDEVYPARADIEQDIAEECAFGFFSDDRLSGYVALNESYDREYDALQWKYDTGRFLILHRLAVHPAYQGGGIAGKLTTFAETYAADNGYTAIRLDTFSGNPIALHLYRKKGYLEAGTVRFRKGSFVVFEKKVMPR